MLPGGPGPEQYHDVGRHFPLHGTRYAERVLIRRNTLLFSAQGRPHHAHKAAEGSVPAGAVISASSYLPQHPNGKGVLRSPIGTPQYCGQQLRSVEGHAGNHLYPVTGGDYRLPQLVPQAFQGALFSLLA